MPRLALLCISMCLSCSGDGPLPDTSTPLQGDISELPAQVDISTQNDAFLSLDTLSDALPDALSQEPCNGAVEYCDKNYNQFVHACTHNAMSSAAYKFTLPSPNQEYTITRQLDDGIRCLMLDIYWVLGELFLCHGVCGPWGQLSLHDTLVEIRDWLDMNPRETLTLILETYVTKQQFLEALIEAELVAANAKPNQDYPLFFHPKLPGSPWPTLRTMIDSNQRLVILTDEKIESTGWYLDWREFGWETPFNDPALDCSKGRGDAQTSPNGVFILNHFLTCETGGCTEKSIPLNGSETIINRARECAQVDDVQNPGGQVPTFINVDHYQVPSTQGDPNIPDMIEAIHTLNQSGNWEELP